MRAEALMAITNLSTTEEVRRCFEEYPDEIQRAGYSIGDLLDAGCELWQLGKAGGYSVADVLEHRPDLGNARAPA